MTSIYLWAFQKDPKALTLGSGKWVDEQPVYLQEGKVAKASPHCHGTRLVIPRDAFLARWFLCGPLLGPLQDMASSHL